ncbi:MAG TPA: exonuclease subunit SbcD [Ruminococcus sp.]|nr:exonuclease subunit SbcD [Ruminococcus sp.]
MKIMHIGDLHLGKSLGDFDLKDDQKYILNQLLKIVDDQSINAVLIAGDVYDKAIPSEAATSMLDFFLSSLAKRKVYTYMISGNHDSDERLNYGSNLFETNNIFISTKYDGKLYKQTLAKDKEEIDIYLLPFVKASQVRHYLPEAKIETYDDAVRAIIDSADIDPARCNFIVAHLKKPKRSNQKLINFRN